MLNDKIGYTIAEISDHYGIDIQIDKLDEEIRELIEAVKEYKNLETADTEIHLIEEMADAMIMIEGVAYLLDDNDIFESLASYKVGRQLIRMKYEEKES